MIGLDVFLNLVISFKHLVTERTRYCRRFMEQHVHSQFVIVAEVLATNIADTVGWFSSVHVLYVLLDSIWC